MISSGFDNTGDYAVIRFIWRYAHALETRFFLFDELNRLRKEGKNFPRPLWYETWRLPSETEDWINIMRFIDPIEKLLLIDVGANDGKWAERFLKFFPNTKVIAFEPTSLPFERLKKRFENNKDIEIHRFAISNVNVRAPIFIGTSDTLSSFEKYEDEVNIFYQNKYTHTEEVECKTLDSFRIKKDERLICLKVDTQGHEVEVFLGATELLPQVDLCIVEVSFVKEYKDKEPSFVEVAGRLRRADLYPVVFQDYGRVISNYAFERDVIFAKLSLLNKIFFNKT